MMAGLTDR
jgi:osomolarity two-component system response regulator SKN7